MPNDYMDVYRTLNASYTDTQKTLVQKTAEQSNANGFARQILIKFQKASSDFKGSDIAYKQFVNKFCLEKTGKDKAQIKLYVVIIPILNGFMFEIASITRRQLIQNKINAFSVAAVKKEAAIIEAYHQVSNPAKRVNLDKADKDITKIKEVLVFKVPEELALRITSFLMFLPLAKLKSPIKIKLHSYPQDSQHTEETTAIIPVRRPG